MHNEPGAELQNKKYGGIAMKFWNWLKSLFRKAPVVPEKVSVTTSTIPQWKPPRDKWIRVNMQFSQRLHVWHENRKGKHRFMYSGQLINGTTIIRNPYRRNP